LLKAGILWSVGDSVKAEYDTFLAGRTKMRYEKRDNIANYERRPEPLPYQFPLSAEDSMAYTQAPMGWNLELFASEPDIINPIGLAWDERGRLWAAETIDYPNEVRPDHTNGNDKIKILEDTDGDGKCDKVTVFADGLNIPNSLTFANGGVLVSQPPHILFMKDTDGDDKADVKEILFSGWGVGDTHATCANLRYGVDNWVYGSVGYSGFDGEVGGERLKFSQGVFRFRPDGSKLEFLYQFNNNTWGVGFNEEGDVFGSTANNNPSFFGGIPATLYPKGQQGMSAKMIADSPTFHPITPNVRQVDVFGGYTAGAGHTIATSNAFPESYRDKVAFICGPTGRLLGKYRIDRDGAGYKATNAFAMVASADDWFAPVAAEIGPDGGLWIADWYNFIIQHNPTPSVERGGYAGVNGKGNAHVNPLRDREHGRIYRLHWEKAPKPAITSLADADTATLVAALGDGNQFWRLHAQRLLVAGGKKDAEAALKEQVKSGGLAAIHALWSLHGLGLLDRETHLAALLSPDAGLRRNAIRALGTEEADIQLFFASPVVGDPDLLVRLAAFDKLAEFPDTELVTRSAQQLMRDETNRNDEWLSLALKLAGAKGLAKGPAKLGPNLLANPSFEKGLGGQAEGWRSMNHSGNADFALDEKVFHSGQRSARISATRGGDSSWSMDVRVKPQTDYRFSAWVKTENVRGAMGALLNIHQLQRQALPDPLQGTKDWTELVVDFNSGGNSSLMFNCLFGGWGQSTGTAWWDDVALSEVTYEIVEEAAAAEVTGVVDNGKKIFSEHLIAACILCHAVDGKGGVVGPALDGIATRKDQAYILESLVDPGAKLAEGFPGEISPMPPMGVLLKPQELADVMAYLMTLK
jgi:putative membrane-bound dehydrogenase-like protein